MTFKVVRNLFIFAVVLIFLKAFYFDAWYTTKYADHNETSESIVATDEVSEDENLVLRGQGIQKVNPEDALGSNNADASGMKPDKALPLNQTGMNDKEKMPIDKFGDSIAKSLKGKVEVEPQRKKENSF
jgi:hypothetical protein